MFREDYCACYIRCFELGKSVDGVGERRTKAWPKYVDNVFMDLILGK